MTPTDMGIAFVGVLHAAFYGGMFHEQNPLIAVVFVGLIAAGTTVLVRMED